MMKYSSILKKSAIIDSVTNPYSRQYGDKIIFFENIDSAGLQLASEGLKEMKERIYTANHPCC